MEYFTSPPQNCSALRIELPFSSPLILATTDLLNWTSWIDPLIILFFKASHFHFVHVLYWFLSLTLFLVTVSFLPSESFYFYFHIPHSCTSSCVVWSLSFMSEVFLQCLVLWLSVHTKEYGHNKLIGNTSFHWCLHHKLMSLPASFLTDRPINVSICRSFSWRCLVSAEKNPFPSEWLWGESRCKFDY